MKVKRILITVLTVVLLVSMLSGCSQKEEGESAGELNVYTWQGYVPPDIVTRFQEETGITINYSYFSTNEEMLAKLEATEGGEYDFIICSDYAIQLAIEEGLLQEIDSSRIANYGNINPVYQNQYYDPDNKYSIPYWICSKAVLYNPAETDLKFEHFSDLADPSLTGKVAVTNSSRDIIGAALQELGYDVNETDEDKLLEAEAFLKEMRPNIMAFDTDNPEGIVVNGDAIVAYCNAPQCIAGILQDPSLAISYPETGASLIGIDAIVVPKNAPNLENLYTFLNFELDPDVVAQATEYTHYPNAVLNYEDYYDEDFDKSQVVLLPDSIMANAEMIESVGDAQAIYDRIWTELK